MADEDISLTLEKRTITGKAVKQLRRDGFLPAVIHDHGKPSINVSGAYLQLHRAYLQAGKHQLLQLKVGDQSYTVLIKTAEFDPRKHRLNHIVFGAVKSDEKVTAEIPVRLSDDIPAEKMSLVVINQLDNVEVEALPKDLPDELVIDASGLIEIGDKVSVSDIVPPPGVTIMTDPTHAIATVYEPSALAAANESAGGAAEAETPAEEAETAGEAAETEGAEPAAEGSGSTPTEKES
ncbi:MAG TPA: 50S ribosomal protein L25 [Candidatus Saccharimonadales bacterium]|jgi:large subunit ribosomal protein L25|nr:50S ribosomal protein L25 [Candidatus Saccharimonadales bacterium]